MHGQDGASTLMSIRDAARASGLSPKALRRRIERGTLGSVLVGARRRIPVDDLVRRGLVPDGTDPTRASTTGAVDGSAGMVSRLEDLESRVAALESALYTSGRAAAAMTPAPPVAQVPGAPPAAPAGAPSVAPSPVGALMTAGSGDALPVDGAADGDRAR